MANYKVSTDIGLDAFLAANPAYDNNAASADLIWIYNDATLSWNTGATATTLHVKQIVLGMGEEEQPGAEKAGHLSWVNEDDIVCNFTGGGEQLSGIIIRQDATANITMTGSSGHDITFQRNGGAVQDWSIYSTAVANYSTKASVWNFDYVTFDHAEYVIVANYLGANLQFDNCTFDTCKTGIQLTNFSGTWGSFTYNTFTSITNYCVSQDNYFGTDDITLDHNTFSNTAAVYSVYFSGYLSYGTNDIDYSFTNNAWDTFYHGLDFYHSKPTCYERGDLTVTDNTFSTINNPARTLMNVYTGRGEAQAQTCTIENNTSNAGGNGAWIVRGHRSDTGDCTVSIKDNTLTGNASNTDKTFSIYRYGQKITFDNQSYSGYTTRSDTSWHYVYQYYLPTNPPDFIIKNTTITGAMYGWNILAPGNIGAEQNIFIESTCEFNCYTALNIVCWNGLYIDKAYINTTLAGNVGNYTFYAGKGNYDDYTYPSMKLSKTALALKTDATAPSWDSTAGIQSLTAIGNLGLLASWNTASEDYVPSFYQIYIKKDNDTSLFTASYLYCRTDKTKMTLFTDADGNAFASGDTYYVGVKAIDMWENADANTTSLNAVVSGSTPSKTMQEQQLGQARPTNTTAVSIYSPSVGETAVITTLVICNNSSSTATYRIFIDDDGTTYDQSTAIFYDVSIDANTTSTIQTHIGMNNSSGNIAVRSGTASALTFTAHGAVIS